MKQRLVLAFVLALAPSLAWTQGAVQQVGPATIYDLTAFIRDHQIEAASKLFNDNGRGVNPVHTFDNKGTGSCWEDALTTGPYHEFCITHDGAGNTLFTTTSQNGAPQSGVNFLINGNIYPFPGNGTGNVNGPTPTVIGDVACWNNTVGTLLNDCGTATTPITHSLIVGVDPAGGFQPTGPTAPVALISATGAKNALAGQVNNSVAYATNQFLAVGVSGYGKVPTGTASVAYGLYGVGELGNQYGEATNEVTVRNLSGANAAAGPVPPLGVPSTNALVDGLQITCGSGTGTSDCSVGLIITNDSEGGASNPEFNTAETILGFRNMGLYIDPDQTTGTQNTMQLNNNGNGLNLNLKTTGAMTALNPVLVVYDAGNTSHAAIFQNGDIHGNDIVAAGGYSVGATPGAASCGVPSASFAVVGGIVTHC